MFGYAKHLKKYRPLLRPSYFLKKTGDSTAKKARIRKMIIRDWLYMVLWYVRLKKQAKGRTPYPLLEVERQVHAE